MSKLFCFGLGYSAQTLGRRLLDAGWTVCGTTTHRESAARLGGIGYETLLYDGRAPGTGVFDALSDATHVVVSIPPDDGGDPVLRHHASDLAEAPNLRWIGYLSTVGIYGDHQGAWVDETTPAAPISERSRWRLAAERAWLQWSDETGKRVEVFRLAGIYGPKRSAIDNLREGTARSIVKAGQVFNRIHVDDIATVLIAAMEHGGRHQIYNVADDEPAPPQDVIAYAAGLIGTHPPPEIPFETATLSPMARSFYGENKRVSNARLKSDLGVVLSYPTYREGLRAIAGKTSGAFI